MMISADSDKKVLLSSTIYQATNQGNLQLVKDLIESGTNPLDKDVNDDTLLH